jgi:hypothetical protein
MCSEGRKNVACGPKNLKRTELRGFDPRANYTDRETTACWRSYCQLLRIEGVAWSAQRIPTVVNLGFLDEKPNLSFKLQNKFFCTYMLVI